MLRGNRSNLPPNLNREGICEDEDRLSLPLRLLEGVIERRMSLAHLNKPKLQMTHQCCAFERFSQSPSQRVIWIRDHGDGGQARDDLLEKLQPLGANLVG